MNPLIKSPKFTEKFDFASKHFVVSDTTLRIPNDFASIPKALNFLKDKVWSKTTTVTILIDSGVYDVTAPIVVKQDLVIKGKTVATKTITGLVSNTGSSGNWVVTYNVSDTTGLAVGMLVNINSTTGTGDYNHHRGCWEITAIPTSTRITVKNTNRKGTFSSTVTGGTILVPLTQLKTTSNTGIFYFNNCSIQIENLVLKGNSTGPDYSNTAININDSILIPINVGINNFYCGVNSFNNSGIHSTDPTYNPYVISISNCNQGITGKGIKLTYRSIQATGCIQLGLLAMMDHCAVAGSTSCFLGNTMDIQAQYQAYVHVQNTLFETTSPAINTVGNGNSYISNF